MYLWSQDRSCHGHCGRRVDVGSVGVPLRARCQPVAVAYGHANRHANRRANRHANIHANRHVERVGHVPRMLSAIADAQTRHTHRRMPPLPNAHGWIGQRRFGLHRMCIDVCIEMCVGICGANPYRRLGVETCDWGYVATVPSKHKTIETHGQPL